MEKRDISAKALITGLQSILKYHEIIIFRGDDIPVQMFIHVKLVLSFYLFWK